ncbi:MAG: outer membrane beta-barrel protein [Gemmatimonadota bacterium]
MRRLATPIVLSLLAAAAPAAAQGIPSPYRFVDYGQDLGAFASRIGTDRGTMNLGPDGGLAFGLQYSLRINDPMALSARATYFATERAIIDTITTVDGELTTQSEGTAPLDLLLLTARLQLTLTGARTWHGIAPHVFVGGGLAIATSEADDPVTVGVDNRYSFGNAFMGQLGFGASIFLGDRWSLRLSVLDDLWQIRAPRGLQDVNLTPTAPDSEWTHNLEISAGLHHHF